MFKVLRALSWPVSTSALLTKFSLFAKLSAEVTCLVISHARRFFSTSPILSGSCIDADLRILQWRFACNGKATSFIPFFWDPYAGLYTDHFSDSYSGPKCDSIASILLVPSESRTKHSESTKLFNSPRPSKTIIRQRDPRQCTFTHLSMSRGSAEADAEISQKSWKLQCPFILSPSQFLKLQ